MGFRSYVRHFRGAILELLRPSEAWCFPAGRCFFSWCFPSGSQQQQQQKSVQQQEEKVAKMQQQKSVQELFHGVFHPGASSSSSKSLILVLLWVSEVTLGIFGVQFWSFSVLQRHGVLLPSGSQQQQQQKSVQQQEEKVAKMHT